MDSSVEIVEAGESRQEVLVRLAKDAIMVQSASNFSGVQLSFCKMMQELRDVGVKTHELARHPIVVLWVDKLHQLCGYTDALTFSKAFEVVSQWSRGEFS